MKEIPLTQGKFAIVDDEDFVWLTQWSWCVIKGYAVRSCTVGPKKRIAIYMHGLIAQTPHGMGTDHANGNILDNRRNNLRVCTRSQNRGNMNKTKFNTSGYKGVFKNGLRWVAQIKKDGHQVHIGTFDNKEDAARAYDKMATEYFGEFAKINFPESVV